MKMLSILAIFLWILSGPVYARLLQIIHTNDLHSHFEGIRDGRGGYARIKSVVDRLRTEANSQGIPSLYLDAGDFGEGDPFYFSNRGRDSLRALDLLGVEASVLGNHDYILGGQELASQLQDSGLKASLLAANVKGKKKMGLDTLLPNYKDFLLDGMKVRVVGLTTPDLHFQYPLRPQGRIKDPLKVGIREADQAYEDDVDFLIALTHTGIDRDRILAQNTRNYGLVVGGHDHFIFERPQMVENLEGHLVPILQAGSNTMYVGNLLVDVVDGVAQVIDYDLIPITIETPEDATVKAFSEDARKYRSSYFADRWEEVIGFSTFALTGEYEGIIRNTRQCWSHHIARMTRLKAQTQLAFQFDTFQGQEIPPGPITYGDLIENFPHFRNWGDNGWKVVRGKASGLLLKYMLKYLKKAPNFVEVTIDGLKALEEDGESLSNYDLRRHAPFQARIQGRPLHNLKFYSVALPSEVLYGMRKTSKFLTNLLILKQEEVIDSDYWPMLESYIRENSPLTCLAD